MARVRPKNWKTFQHYKDRSPPWIKLHKSLLDDYEFQGLPIASRALAPMLWLLASEDMEGWIDIESSKLAFRLRISQEELTTSLNPLINIGLFQSDASKPIARRKRSAMPEKRRGETQVEKSEVETEQMCAEPMALALPTNREGEEVSIFESEVTEFSKLYPSVDIRAELRAMRGWLISNPKNRKTKGGMHRFINAWLSKQQNRSRPNGNGSAQPTAHDKFIAGALSFIEANNRHDP
jgi:hypothetical protein